MHGSSRVKKDLSELRKIFSKLEVSKLEAELSVTKQVNNVLQNQMVQVERKFWSNEQYFRHECLQIVGSPAYVTDSSLEETPLNIFKELGSSIDTSDIEACPM